MAAATPEEPKYGGIARIAVRKDAGGAWDIMKITGWVDMHQMGAPIWGSGNLTQPCREDVYQVCPALAASWESNSDSTQWTFKMRDDVLWHDGKPFTAQDAKFWLELASFGVKSGDKTRLPAWFRADLGDVKKVETLDGNRVRVTLGSPSRFYPYLIGRTHLHLAHPWHLMQPRIDKGEVDVAPQDIEWVGTGPFSMLKHELGTRVQVQRSGVKYWEKDSKGRQLPYLDGIDFAIIRDPSAMDAAIRVGRLDGGAPAASYVLSTERQAAYSRDMGDKVWFAQAPSTSGATIFGFNLLKPGPHQDVRVRKAISLWMDREAAIPTWAAGFGQISTILNPQNPFVDPDFKTWPGWNRATKTQDRAEAKRLLAEAGYATGVSLTHPCWTAWIVLCEYLQGQLAGLGVDLKLTTLDQAARTRAVTSLDYDTLVADAPRSAIPEGLGRILLPYSLSPISSAKHEDLKITEFFKQLNDATSLDQRVKLWRDMERYYLLEKVYAVTVVSQSQVVPYRSYLKGIKVPQEDLQNYLDHATAWLDR